MEDMIGNQPIGEFFKELLEEMAREGVPSGDIELVISDNIFKFKIKLIAMNGEEIE